MPALRRAAVLAALPLLLATTPASASDAQHLGGCGWSGLLGYSHYAGDPFRWTRQNEVHVRAVVHSPSDPARPVTARVTCFMKVDGSTEHATPVSATGTGVVAGVGLMRYDAWSGARLEFCTEVDYLGDATPTLTYCDAGTLVPWPQDTFDEVFWGTYALAKGSADASLCPVFAEHAGEYGPVTVQPDGDVLDRGRHSWDCAPYGDWEDWE